MKCKLCKKIYNNKSQIDDALWDDVQCGIYDDKNNYYLYMPAWDPYCSPSELQIKYCPVCGKELKKKEEIQHG